jgi:hypothetical protein
MPRPPSPSGGPLPRWLIAAGSAVIIFHLSAITVAALDAPSGPWVTAEGPRPAEAPAFVHSASDLAKAHADYLRIAHNYHNDVITTRPADVPGVEFDVRLKNEKGEVIETLHFPDPKANPWVRHRQQLLATGLALDLPVESQGADVIAAPGEKVPTLSIWALPGEDFSGMQPPGPPPGRNVPYHLQAVPQHLVPRANVRMVMRPSDLSLLLAHSYARYLCHTHGAASAEIVRHVRQAVSPAVLFGGEPPPGAFDEFIASFGEMPQ